MMGGRQQQGRYDAIRAASRSTAGSGRLSALAARLRGLVSRPPQRTYGSSKRRP